MLRAFTLGLIGLGLLGVCSEAEARRTTGLERTQAKAIAKLKVEITALRVTLRATERDLRGAPTLQATVSVPIITRLASWPDVDIHEHPGTVPEAPRHPDPRVRYADHVTHGCFPAALTEILEDASRHFGSTVYVFSGHRSHQHNRRVRGAKRSQHLICKAADFRVAGADYREVARYLYRHRRVGGLGLYSKKFFHVDVRKTRTVWSQFPAKVAREMLEVGSSVRIASYGRRRRS